MTPTRGERNNNPGNIVRDGDHWQGMAADQSGDSRFVVFETAHFGIRALGVILKNYQRKHGLKTVREIITRWAPPEDHNNTEAYISAVAGEMGVEDTATIDLNGHGTMRGLVVGVIRHENGRVAYGDDVIDLALEAV